jgi:predicted phosphodiesterase
MKSLREKIVEKIQEIGFVDDLNKRLYDCYEDFCDEDMSLQAFKMYCGKIKKQYIESGYLPNDKKEEFDLFYHNNDMVKKNQILQDKNRILTKQSRESNRVLNALEELSSEISKNLSEVNLKEITIKHNTDNTNQYYGIVHLTDLHANELIDICQNKYDFEIMSKRLKKFAIEIKRNFNSYGIKNILIANTGDFLNSDRRLDEKLSMASNRSKATIQVVYLLEQFILDLNKSFNINIATVIGNESRVSDEMTFSENIASDNYDVMIDNMLRMLFKNCEGINFINGSYIEKYIKIGNFGLFLSHGSSFSVSPEKAIYSKMAKYSQEGKNIDYALFGHIHSAFVSDYFSRGASLSGGNSYSDIGLNLISRASQNIIIINTENKERHGIKIDLQVSDIEGYNIFNNCCEYNPTKNLSDFKTIIEIVI